MTTVFVYEHITAIGARGDQPLAPSFLAEGRAMRDAIAADFAAIPGVRILSIPVEDEATFRRCASESDFSFIIAPETAGILEERCRWAMESGTRVLGPSLEAIRLTTDKLALAKHFEREGVPHPQTGLLQSAAGLESWEFRFPLVWKPRDGAGSQMTYLILDEPAAQARDRASTLACAAGSLCMIAQEYVEGIAASVAFLIGPKAHLALQPCRQHLSDDGRFRYLGGSLPLPGDLAARAIALGECAIKAVPGLQGYIGIDLVLADDAKNDCVIEINPRLTTSYVGLRQLARFNIAEELLKIVRGETISNLLWGTNPIHFLPDGSLQGQD